MINKNTVVNTVCGGRRRTGAETRLRVLAVARWRCCAWMRFRVGHSWLHHDSFVHDGQSDAQAQTTINIYVLYMCVCVCECTRVAGRVHARRRTTEFLCSARRREDDVDNDGGKNKGKTNACGIQGVDESSTGGFGRSDLVTVCQ